jgi:hypothetical protein
MASTTLQRRRRFIFPTCRPDRTVGSKNERADRWCSETRGSRSRPATRACDAGYDPEAHRLALDAVKAFLASALKAAP